MAIKTGRKSKLTPIICRKIYRCLINGNSMRGTCLLVKIDQSTIDKWLSEGRKHDIECSLEYRDCLLEQHEEAAKRIFSLNVKRAKELNVDWHVKNIKRHAKKEWTPSAWMLERTHRDEFGKEATIHHSVGGEVKHTHTLKTVTPIQKSRIADALKQQAILEMSEDDSGTFVPLQIEGNTTTQE